MKGCKMILPKRWLQRIPRYWDATVPTGYPATSSEFSHKFEKEEVAVAVKDMEEKLNTEESIITEEMIPEGRRVGAYLGTYDVKGVAGEEVLISPVEVTSKDVAVIAFHYNEESDAWEKIEDAHIKNGYVYGTVESFSPISVFTVRRSAYVLAADVSPLQVETFVANGNPVTVAPTENGGVVVTCMGEKVEMGSNKCAIVGGAINESIESSSVYADSVKVDIIIAGSFCDKEQVEPVTMQSAFAEIVNCEVTAHVIGTGRCCRTEKVTIKMKDTKSAAFGNCRSNLFGKDCNTEDNLNFCANQWVKESYIELDNCEVNVMYISGISGFSYSANANAIINGGKFNYLVAAGSNGRTDKGTLKVSNAEIKKLFTTNRGTVGEAKMTVIDCNVEELYICGDSIDKDVTGTIDKVSYDITGGSMNLYAGTNGGIPITYEDACKIVSAVKISRRSNVEYKEKADYLLGDIIKIK